MGKGNGHEVAVKLLLAKDGVEKSGDGYQWPVFESMLVLDCSLLLGYGRGEKKG